MKLTKIYLFILATALFTLSGSVCHAQVIANAARLLGVDKQRGAIKAGQAADIIATSENPLENIQTLKQVFFVMKNGKVIKRAK